MWDCIIALISSEFIDGTEILDTNIFKKFSHFVKKKMIFSRCESIHTHTYMYICMYKKNGGEPAGSFSILIDNSN